MYNKKVPCWLGWRFDDDDNDDDGGGGGGGGGGGELFLWYGWPTIGV